MLKIIVLYLVINLVAVPAFNFSKVIGTSSRQRIVIFWIGTKKKRSRNFLISP